jgi:hypothetical protein
MSLGGAALMLQEAVDSSRETMAAAATRAIHTLREPQVGNFSWEVVFADPDGYRIHFSSPTDQPEETLLSDIQA